MDNIQDGKLTNVAFFKWLFTVRGITKSVLEISAIRKILLVFLCEKVHEWVCVVCVMLTYVYNKISMNRKAFLFWRQQSICEQVDGFILVWYRIVYRQELLQIFKIWIDWWWVLVRLTFFPIKEGPYGCPPRVAMSLFSDPPRSQEITQTQNTSKVSTLFQEYPYFNTPMIQITEPVVKSLFQAIYSANSVPS